MSGFLGKDFAKQDVLMPVHINGSNTGTYQWLKWPACVWLWLRRETNQGVFQPCQKEIRPRLVAR